MRMNLYQRFQRRRRARQFQQFRDWYEMHEQARTFTTQKCPRCLAPASTPTAKYCAECGVPLHQQQNWMPEQEAHTDPIQLSVRQRAIRRTVASTDTLYMSIPPLPKERKVHG